MSQALSSLAYLTLRQLRRLASDFGVMLYSRKSKRDLILAIAARQQQRDDSLIRAIEAELAVSSHPRDRITKVVFIPKDPHWAYVFWEISEIDRRRAQSEGANCLHLRLADMTDIGASSLNHHTFQEVTIDSHNTEWYLPIPVCNRDYRIELGYRSKISSDWISLAFSSIARVPGQYPSKQMLDQFVPFSLETTSEAVPVNPTRLRSDSRLHERLYQSAATHLRQRQPSPETLCKSDNAATNRCTFNSGIGIWASGRGDPSPEGRLPRRRPLWLAADAELIVYGTTDPSARLTISGQDVPLSVDGTFRIQVPFRDGDQTYAIEATATDSEQKCNITLAFERCTPEDNSNPVYQTRSEWF